MERFIHSECLPTQRGLRKLASLHELFFSIVFFLSSFYIPSRLQPLPLDLFSLITPLYPFISTWIGIWIDIYIYIYLKYYNRLHLIYNITQNNYTSFSTSLQRPALRQLGYIYYIYLTFTKPIKPLSGFELCN